MDTTTIRNVELMSVGMEWPSASGPITFTFEHLHDAMVAANEDPHVVPPRLKLGHSDPRFADEVPDHDPFYDGEPALGSVRNLHLVNDGATLVGDYSEVPTWLAEALPTAYPSRSIEGAWFAAEGAAGEPKGSWEVKTPGGKTYSFVLTACALLGLSRPAVEDLDDLQRFITEGEGVVIAGAAPDGGEAVAARMGSVPAVQMTADIDKVIETFYAEFAPDPSDPRYWWWVRSAWTDPNRVIVDDDEGSLYSVPFSSDKNQQVSFGEPEEVLQSFVPAPAAAAAMATGIYAGSPAAVFKHRAETPAAERRKNGAPGGASASGRTQTMDFSPEQRSRLVARLGLEEDATEDQILDVLAADPDPDPDPDEGNGDGNGETPPETPPEDPPADPPAEGTPAASAGPETVTVEKGVWEDMQSKVARLAAQDEVRVKAEREAAIEKAVADGKILPAAREGWLTKMHAAPEATAAELASLAPGLVPTSEVGHSISPTEASAIEQGDAAFAQLFPNLAQKE